MEFGVLGPLRVNGGDIALPAKPRAALAVLLLRANRIVPVDTLIDALWDDAPPPSARTTLQGYVKQLRRCIGPHGGTRVVTRPPGYLIAVEDGELDLDRFTRLCDEARAVAARDDWADAAARLEEALALWRDAPLANVHSAVLRRTEVPRLAELRMLAVESRMEAALRLGRHGELVAELRRLTSEEPLRERLHGQLMLALYRCGRQAEALEVFRGIDRRLRDEVGVCAARELQELHQRILAADPSLTAAPPLPSPDGVRPSAGTHLVPAQVPPDTVDFTGREEQARLLCDLLAAPPEAGRAGAVVISAVAGMGGIGKTALAVHVAHRLRARFPDGQLYVSLRGATRPLRPAEALARMLRDMGDTDTIIPAGEDERAARYRSLLAGRKTLIVLDDALSAAQVRPLLPGSAGCAVIVTSRATLHSLAGAVRLDLDALGADEARDLFAAIIGEARAAAEPEAMATVLACCAGLPLAVRIAGSRLASRPAWSIAHMAAKLADKRNRLAELATGDIAVRASFAVSYDALAAARPDDAGADPARVFRLLGLPDMAELSLTAIAALAGQPEADVTVALETLTDAHLLESMAADRYRLHDLLRTYAAELSGRAAAADAGAAEDGAAALSRLLTWYAQRAVVAAQALAPRTFPIIVPAPAVAVPTDAAAAFGWFEAEMVNLVVAARQAADQGRHDLTAQIGIAMREFLQRTPYIDVWLAVSQAGVDSARHLGDEAVLSFLLMGLGQAQCELSCFSQAYRSFNEALEIRRRTGDRSGEALILNCQAITLFQQNRPEQALEHMRSALDILRAVDDRSLTGLVLNNMGHMLRSLKRYGEALDHLEQALDIQQAGDGFRMGITEITLGQTCLDLGRYEEAAVHGQRALASFDGITLGNRNRADALFVLGDSLSHLGRAQEAREAWFTALAILDQIGDPLAAEVRGRLAASAIPEALAIRR